jgi:chloramphenicol 3-O-phosphotransferase
MDARYRLNSRGDFFYPEAYLRLDNSEMAPGEAARRIKERFDLR